MTCKNPAGHELNACGCGEGTGARTPRRIENRPGLAAISYRVGTHPDFKATLEARFSGADVPALRGLRTRSDEDFTIGLLDAFATVADVLTFYQERIANESFLRTATERLSLREMARLIGYSLRPGVAASADLEFTIENLPGTFGQGLTLAASAQSAIDTPASVLIDTGTRVQSVPGPGEKAQTFETVEPIEARSEWNAIRPRMTQPQSLTSSVSAVILDGNAANLRAGDVLLLRLSGGTAVLKTVLRVTVAADNKSTRVDFAANSNLSPGTYSRPGGDLGSLEDFPVKVDLDSSVVAEIAARTWREGDLSALAELQEWPPHLVARTLNAYTASREAATGGSIYAMRQRAAVFGYNAPKQPGYNTNGTPTEMSTWTDPDPASDEHGNVLFLDGAYDGVVSDGLVAVTKSTGSPAAFQISTVETFPRTEYGISSKTSKISFTAGTWWNPDVDAFSVIRGASVLVRSELLPPAPVPIDDDIAEDTLTLDRAYVGLKPGRRIVLTGERTDLPGELHNEVRTLKEVWIEKGFTVIVLDVPLTYGYVRETVLINANVALATHGETVQEILGGGNASQAFQQFVLRQPPLTHVTAATPSGTDSTLEVRVNGILWDEVPFLYGRGPQDRVFTTEMDDEGRSRVIFGDGIAGQRLPTGQSNVTAKYRKGIGLAGRVEANRLTQLVTQPLGVKAVTNPLAAAGAADPEDLGGARENAPLTVLTLDRLVSIQDYADFARAFSGIGKAHASWVWDGQKRGVFVTVAAADGAAILTDSDLHQKLIEAMREFGDPAVPLWVESYSSILFRIAARVFLDPDYLEDTVIAAIEEAVRAQFSFEARSFAQPVFSSEVITLIQSVEGVIGVDLNELYRVDQPAGEPLRHASLIALSAHLKDGIPLAAELLTLDPSPIALEVE